jgi:hypothetical protein
LGNRRAQNCEGLVNNFLQSYQKLGCKVTESTLPSLAFAFFPENCGAVSDEEDSFHQEISSM